MISLNLCNHGVKYFALARQMSGNRINPARRCGRPLESQLDCTARMVGRFYISIGELWRDYMANRRCNFSALLFNIYCCIFAKQILSV